MKKFIRKSTAWNFFAGFFVILFMIAVAANAILIKFNFLSEITGGNFYIRAWAADYVTENIKGITFAAIVDYLPVLGVALGAFLLLLLPICFHKHGKGWNWIPLLLMIGDTVWFAIDAFKTIKFEAPDGLINYLKDVFSAPFERFLTPPDINLMAHVLIILFLAFATARGTKKVPLGAVEGPEKDPTYRTITVMRKIAPFARTTAFDCWFNGENLSEIADGQEKSFLVDEYGAEFVVVSPTGEESNIVNIPEGNDDEKYVISTGRNAKGELRIEIARA